MLRLVVDDKTARLLKVKTDCPYVWLPRPLKYADNFIVFSCKALFSALSLCVFVLLQPSGHYMYHQFNIQQFCVLPTQFIYVFCVDLRTNSDYFPVQH